MQHEAAQDVCSCMVNPQQQQPVALPAKRVNGVQKRQPGGSPKFPIVPTITAATDCK